MKQLSIFDYMEHEVKNENDFITYFVDWLKAYCKYWNKDWIERAHDTEKLVRFIKGDDKNENRFM